MISNKLNQWLDDMFTEGDLIKGTYPGLTTLLDETWDKSELGKPLGCNNGLIASFNQLDASATNDVVKLVRTLDEKDLVDLMPIGQRELEARRGLALLNQTYEQIGFLSTQATANLRKWQALRDVAVFELERRSREKMIAAGMHEPMEQFLSRFLIGPPPPPMMPPCKPPIVLGLKEKDFLLARVKSGKQVAVENLRFHIPDQYDSWVMSRLKQASLVDNNTHYHNQNPPMYANMKISQLYYKLGFKPVKEVTIQYSIQWHQSTWNKGWYLSHSREAKAMDLVPID